MKNISIALAIIIITGFAFTAQAQTTKSSGIKDVDFSNFSYRTSFDDPKTPKTISLSGGKFEEGGSYDSGGTLYELFGQPAYGDLNGDKSEEAVIEIKMSAPSTLRAFEVQVYTFQKGAPKMLARLDDSLVLKDYRKYYPKTDLHYAGTNPPKIEKGQVIIEALTEGNFACPKYTAVFTYKLSAGKFVLSGKPVRKSFNCNQ